MIEQYRDFLKSAWTSVVLISVGLVYSVTINFLAMFPSTMCLRIAGGDGCG